MDNHPFFKPFNVLGFGGAIEASLLLFVLIVFFGLIGIQAREHAASTATPVPHAGDAPPPLFSWSPVWSVLTVLVAIASVVYAVRTGVRNEALYPYLFAPFIAVLAYYSNPPRVGYKNIGYATVTGVCTAFGIALWQFREPLSVLLRAKGWSVQNAYAVSQQTNDIAFYLVCFTLIGAVLFILNKDEYFKGVLFLLIVSAAYIAFTV